MPDGAATYGERDARDVGARLAGTRFHRVQWFPEIDSTNRYLLDEAAGGAAEGSVAVADVQTAGRGRLGRTWEAPPGSSLLVSVLLRPSLRAPQLHLVTTAAALAMAEAVGARTGVDVRLKWPNDLVVGDRKLAGLLAESSPAPDDGRAVVVGCGCNVRWESFPPELVTTATACNLESDRVVDRVDLLVGYLQALDGRLARLTISEDRAALVRDAIAASATVGGRVRVELAREVVEGTATGITSSGHLLLALDGGGEVEVAAGDVVHLRPA